jgi:hypothetical protein
MVNFADRAGKITVIPLLHYMRLMRRVRILMMVGVISLLFLAAVLINCNSARRAKERQPAYFDEIPS